MFKTSLIYQNETVDLLNKVLDDPPHLFFSGGYGSGKTTILHEFLSAYFRNKKMVPTNDMILWLSSEQDRGIHCVRQSVAEFVRHTSATPGIYRWIIVDDADSLPIISQQALRRPMETHSHTTRFLFCSRHVGDLIQPLRSRSMHLELETISPIVLVDHFLKEQGYNGISLSIKAISVFMSIAQTPTQIRNITRIIGPKFVSQAPYEIKDTDIIDNFSAPSFSLCLNLLKAYITNKNSEMISIFIDLWTTGISYEDFLHELDSSLNMLGIIPANISQKIHQILLRGWIYFAQGKTHTLDMMRLFLD
jgi:DNA polymerase III delta prime subunit